MPKIDGMPIDVILKDPDLVAEHLSCCLEEGSLALVVGAGASIGFGLPGWSELVNRCVDAAGTSETVNSISTKYIRRIMDAVERRVGDDRKYRELVRDCLYADVEFDAKVIRQDLLIALGALLMGSSRGSVREVLTLNFDDVLEWYLELHGFHTKVVDQLPFLQKNADVTIYHPHGYLPHTGDSFAMSDFLVFSQMSYDRRMGAQV